MHIIGFNANTTWKSPKKIILESTRKNRSYDLRADLITITRHKLTKSIANSLSYSLYNKLSESVEKLPSVKTFKDYSINHCFYTVQEYRQSNITFKWIILTFVDLQFKFIFVLFLQTMLFSNIVSLQNYWCYLIQIFTLLSAVPFSDGIYYNFAKRLSNKFYFYLYFFVEYYEADSFATSYFHWDRMFRIKVQISDWLRFLYQNVKKL